VGCGAAVDDKVESTVGTNTQAPGRSIGSSQREAKIGIKVWGKKGCGRGKQRVKVIGGTTTVNSTSRSGGFIARVRVIDLEVNRLNAVVVG